MRAGWQAGIDPGAMTALTVALKNTQNGELRHLAIHYDFLERSLTKLEKMQQTLAQKQGRTRKRTPEEIEDSLHQFKSKSKYRKLEPPEQEKALAKKKEALEKRPLRQEASKRWRRWSQRVSALQMRIANQRADVLHKISRALAEGCDVVGMGNWEPEREVSYRKKLRALKKKVKIGVAGAAEELKALQEEKSKQGSKGVKKRRRSGRDRSIASLRRLIEEKAQRASIQAFTEIKEAGSTVTCCVCGAETGPRGDLSIREWRCKECNTSHHRDLNSGFNILRKTEMEIAAAQAAVQERETGPGPIAARTMTQGATGQAGGNSGLRATGSSARGGSFFNGCSYSALPDFWDGDAPKALKSLREMGIARSLIIQNCLEKPPP